MLEYQYEYWVGLLVYVYGLYDMLRPVYISRLLYGTTVVRNTNASSQQAAIKREAKNKAM